MTKEDIKQAVIDALGESGCAKCCQFCDLSPQEHADHHKIMAGAIKTRSTVWVAVITLLTISGLGFLGKMVFDGIKSAVK